MVQKPISGCIACKTCVKTGKCVFDDVVNEFVEKAKDVDGFILVPQYIMHLQEEQLLHLWIEYSIQLHVEKIKLFLV